MSLTNKWLSSSCPEVNDFPVDKSKTEYYIQYFQTKSGVSKVNNDWKDIKKAAIAVERGIANIKDAIDSEDYRAQSEAVIQAVDDSIVAIDSNLTKLFTAIVSRMNASAESDAWFSETAALYANYVATAILGLHGASAIKANMEALANSAAQPTATSDVTTTDTLAQEIGDADIAAILAANEANTTQSTQSAEPQKEEKAGFWGRVGATLGTFASGFVEGIVNIGELAVDAVTVGTAALFTPITAAADAVGAVSSAITGTEYKSATADMWKDAGAFVAKDYSTDWFDSYYENTSLGKTLKNNSYAFDFTRGAGKLTGEIVTVNAIGSAVSAVTSGAQAVSSGTSLATSGGRAAASGSTQLALTSGSGSQLALASGSGSTQLALTSGSSLPAVRSAGAITKVTGAAYSSVGNGNIVCDILDASGNVIGSTTARVVSSTTASTAGNAARTVVNSTVGKAAGVAIVGGTAETIKQSINSNNKSVA